MIARVFGGLAGNDFVGEAVEVQPEHFVLFLADELNYLIDGHLRGCERVDARGRCTHLSNQKFRFVNHGAVAYVSGASELRFRDGDIRRDVLDLPVCRHPYPDSLRAVSLPEARNDRLKSY